MSAAVSREHPIRIAIFSSASVLCRFSRAAVAPVQLLRINPLILEKAVSKGLKCLPLGAGKASYNPSPQSSASPPGCNALHRVFCPF